MELLAETTQQVPQEKFRGVIVMFLRGKQFEKYQARTKKDFHNSINNLSNVIDVKFGDAPTLVFSNPKIRSKVFQWVNSK